MLPDQTKLKAIGQNVRFEDDVRLLHPERISIGDDVMFMYGVYLSPAGSEITIGSNTHFAPYGVLYGPLTIGDNVAVAAHVVFASIGHGYDLHRLEPLAPDGAGRPMVLVSPTHQTVYVVG